MGGSHLGPRVGVPVRGGVEVNRSRCRCGKGLPRGDAGPSLPGCLLFHLKSGIRMVSGGFPDLCVLVLRVNHFIVSRIKCLCGTEWAHASAASAPCPSVFIGACVCAGAPEPSPACEASLSDSFIRCYPNQHKVGWGPGAFQVGRR